MNQKYADFATEVKHLSYQSSGMPKDLPRVLPRFIVFEGIDGSGGSTQARLLEQYLQSRNIPCDCSTEPGKGSIGQYIRTILQGGDCEALLERSKLTEYFAADRAEHIWGPNGIEAKCLAGSYCISERYLFSSLVYQGLDEKAPQSLLDIWAQNKGFPLPQYFFYLDIAANNAEERIDKRQAGAEAQGNCSPLKGREIFEYQDFLSQVRQAYCALIEQFENLQTGMQIHVLNAKQSKESLHRQIRERLSPELPARVAKSKKEGADQIRTDE